MKTFFKILMGLFPLFSWAQENYTSGNITECHTWASFADVYTTLRAVSIKTGTIVGVPEDVNMINLTMNGTGMLSILDTNAVTFDATTDVKCGTVYGTDMGDGKYRYNYSNTLDCSNPVMDNYVYSDLVAVIGPVRKTATYRFTNFRGTIYNYLPKDMSGCSSCYTTDWNLRASYAVSPDTVTAKASITSFIIDHKDRLNPLVICENLRYEVYANDYIFGNVDLKEGDYVRFWLNTVTRPGTGAASKSCCLKPKHYLLLVVELKEL